MKKVLCSLAFVSFSLSVMSQAVEHDWVIQHGSTGRDIALGSHVDAAGNIYSIGIYEGTIDFDPSANTEEITPIGSVDIFICKYTANKDLVWTKSIGSAGWDQGYTLDTDATGNVYIGGTFRNIADFDPGVNTHNVQSNGDFDAFLLKLDSNGDFVWVKTFGGSGREAIFSVKLDQFGNIYASGYYETTVDFDPGASTLNYTSNGDLDGFLSKFDTNGDLVWTNVFGATGQDVGRSLAINSNNNIVLGGSYAETVDFNGAAAGGILVSNGEIDAFINTFDADGNLVWYKGFGGIGADYSYNIALDHLDNIYSTGWYSDAVDFDPGTGVTEKVSAGDNDIYLAKFDVNGDLDWVNSFGNTGNDRGFSVEVDDMQYVYMTGSFMSTVDFDPTIAENNVVSNGDMDVFASIYDTYGDLVWANGFGGSGEDKGRTICTDNNGGLYIAGDFTGTVDFDFDATTDERTSNGQYDGFITKLNIQNLGVGSNDLVEESVVLYPNPASEFVYVDLGTTFMNTTTEIVLTDVTGKVISRNKGINGLNTIALEGVNKGVYFVSVLSDSEKLTKKLIIK